MPYFADVTELFLVDLTSRKGHETASQFNQGYAWCRRHHVGWYSIRKPAAGGNCFELYHHKDGMEITFFDDGNAMGWET